MDLLLEHLGQGFITMLLIAMPAVLTAASIGLVVGILQAVTQVQEQTIAAAPKILGVFIVIMAMGPFSTNTLIKYFKSATNVAFDVIPKDEEMVLSNSQFYEYKKQLHQKIEDKYYNEKTMDVGKMIKNPGKPPYAGTKLKESHRKLPGPESAPNLIEKQQIITGKKE